LAIDRLAVNLGAAIAMIVPGYISTEVDPRLSFDTEASVARGRRIISMYQEMGVPKERVLIKLAATWEGIKAAEILEKEGIQCNLTLIFSFVQAVACAQYGAHLISPFPGRILDWNKVKQGRTQGVSPDEDEGVIAVRKMYNYFKVSTSTSRLISVCFLVCGSRRIDKFRILMNNKFALHPLSTAWQPLFPNTPTIHERSFFLHHNYFCC
jgi:transaldolase